MTLLRFSVRACLVILLASVVVSTQTSTNKEFTKDGLTFDYPISWTIQDDSNKDGQSLTLGRADLDVSINVYVHRGRITPEKLPDAKRAFIDPYILARGKQFIASGAKPVQTSDTTEIAGQKADGVVIAATLAGEPGGAKIYWALVGQRVVLLTYFGPDKQLKQFVDVWDLVRNSLKIEDPKAAPKPSPKP
jgi:hypothetical protein